MSVATQATEPQSVATTAEVEVLPEGLQRKAKGPVRQRLLLRMEKLAQRFATTRIPILSNQRDKVDAELHRIPERMQRVTNQASLVLELVDDFRSGTYRELPWYSIAVASGALLYTVSPADVVPDSIPILGAIDDLVVITGAMRLIRKDLYAYCEFKGYDRKAYFAE